MLDLSIRTGINQKNEAAWVYSGTFYDDLWTIRTSMSFLCFQTFFWQKCPTITWCEKHNKWLQLDKGKGQMDMVFSDPEDSQNERLAQYWVDIHHIMESNEAIANPFEALITLLLDHLPESELEGWESVGPVEEVEQEEDAEE